MANPGSLAGAVPDGEDWIARAITELQRQVRELAAARGLGSSEVGTGGEFLIKGSLRVTGTITVPGTLSAAANIVATTSVAAGTQVSAGTSVIAATDLIASAGYVFTVAGYGFDITYTRRTAWLGNDGRLGWASSSITGKEIIDTIDEPDALKILAIAPRYFHRKAELAKRDDHESPDYVGPHYHVATEWGAIAEELHEQGLWQVVVYEWDTVWDLEDVLDEDGEPILDAFGQHLKRRVPGSERRVPGSEPRPVGVHDHLFGLLAIIAGRFVWEAHKELRRDHDELVEQLRAKGVL